MGNVNREEPAVLSNSLYQGLRYFTDSYLFEDVFPQGLKGEEPGLDCSKSETGKLAIWRSAGHGFDPNMDRESVGKFNSG